MTKRRIFKLVHVKDYIALVEVELVYTEDDWPPYLSLADTAKLDDVCQALQAEDLGRVSQLGRVYRLLPVAV
jgi:hypothetical protein